jgi:hypothetical protein
MAIVLAIARPRGPRRLNPSRRAMTLVPLVMATSSIPPFRINIHTPVYSSSCLIQSDPRDLAR